MVSSAMSGNFSQFDSVSEFHREIPADLDDHKSKVMNSKQDSDDIEVKDPLLKGKFLI